MPRSLTRTLLRAATTVAVLTGPLIAPATSASAAAAAPIEAIASPANSLPAVATVVHAHAAGIAPHVAHARHASHVARRASRGTGRSALSFGQRVIAEASRHIGAPYVWGATGPSSFDCSGFTGYVFARFGIDLPRVAADQYGASRHVSTPRIGDLVFNYGSGGIYHVGIYAGDGEMIAATHTGDVVRREALYGNRLYGRVG